MSTLDDIEIFNSTSTEGAKIENLGKQSIKITHVCGCTLVHHLLVKEKEAKIPENKQSLNANRQYFVELCKTHKYANININKTKKHGKNRNLH